MYHRQLQQRGQLTLLHRFRPIFSDKPGRTTVVEHKIIIVPDARLVRQALYRLHPEKIRCVNSYIEQLLSDGTIDECCSTCTTLILLVSKRDGTERLCVDFRRLNALSEPDPFPMPRIDTLLDRLGGARFMTKLDMTKAYFQVPIAP